MSSILIRGARVLSPADGIDRVMNVYIEDGVIAELDSARTVAGRVIDAAGLVLAPGLVDMHVHLRDPGQTHKEDIFTGCEAAARGGFTSVVCMPNTTPPIDSAETVRYIVEKAAAAKARVYPVCTITRGMAGKELSDFAALKAAGAVAASDDGRPVANAAVMQAAMEACYALDLPVVSHCEDLDIISGGILNKGAVSEALGVRGMDRTSEDTITAREVALAESTGTRIHICHVSTRTSVALIRDAKRRGVQVTCESAPHYMLLTDRELLRRDANWRMNPPLREQADCEAIVEGFCDGTIDAVITDHAPHAAAEKADFEKAPNGIIGLETSFAGACTALVATGKLSLGRLIELMSTATCRILSLPGGHIAAGGPADLCLLDPEEKWTFTERHIGSKSRNTPFLGTEFTGRVRLTICRGAVTFEAED